VNNKLLVGRSLCDEEKLFYCVDHGTLFPEFKFCGINFKYSSYIRTTIYNDSDNSDKVSGWGKVRHRVKVQRKSIISNFNKTNYLHFTTRRNMSVNITMGLNNNFITNISNTKFPGVKMDNTFSWNIQIDLFMTKFSTSCYTISNAKPYMSAC